MFFEFVITLVNQRTGENKVIEPIVDCMKGYREAWQYIARYADDILESQDDHYWYIKSIEHRI